MKLTSIETMSATYELGVNYKEKHYIIIFTSNPITDNVDNIYSEELGSALDKNSELFTQISDELERVWNKNNEDELWYDYMASINHNLPSNDDEEFKTFNEAPYGND
jgi:hypothetical protein